MYTNSRFGIKDISMKDTAEVIAESASTIDWSSWVMVGATIVLVILTGVYVLLTRKILQSQSDPCVVLTVVHDNDRPTILKLVAHNIGQGIARDVGFEFSHPLPAKAYGLTEDSTKAVGYIEDGPLVSGIPALGPGESREVDWGQYGGLKSALGDTTIVATCHFRNNTKQMPPVQCPLEVDSFAGTTAHKSVSAELVQEVKNIATNLERLSKNVGKLQK